MIKCIQCEKEATRFLDLDGRGGPLLDQLAGKYDPRDDLEAYCEAHAWDDGPDFEHFEISKQEYVKRMALAVFETPDVP